MAQSFAFIFALLCALSGCSEARLSTDTKVAAVTPVTSTPVQSQTVSPRTPAHDWDKELPYEVETLTNGLKVPWEMDIAADSRLFFTERPGDIRVIENGVLLKEPVIHFTAPFLSKGEGGLLGLALDPDFSKNHYLYTYHSYAEDGKTKNRVLRLVEKGNKAVLDKVLLSGIPGDTNHNGGRIKIGPDGCLYITTGERYEPELAQDLQSLGGKILRIALDGTIPADNPFPQSPVWSWGHRNPQGLAWHPITHKLFSSEHGQTATDEINLIQPGGNYGWPLINGDQKSSKEKTGLITPLIHSGDTTWAPSGMTFISNGPWKGKLLVANLKGTQVMKISLKEPTLDSISQVDYLFKNEYGRIRNVYEGPDGSLYLMTNNRDGRGTPMDGDDKLLRLKPRY